MNGASEKMAAGLDERVMSLDACIDRWLADGKLEVIGRQDDSVLADIGEHENPDEQSWLLWSCDLSGIQSFIYSISGSKALKQLRARSFYLELLLEHCMDELLERLELTRRNLLYTGGGHAYALLPNTQSTRDALDAFGAELNGWLLEHFATELYCACAYEPCSASDLMNREGSAEDAQRYRSLFQRVGAGLSAAKANRYSAAEILKLNTPVFLSNANSTTPVILSEASAASEVEGSQNDNVGDSSPSAQNDEWDAAFDHSRECSECHRSDDLKKVEDDYLCPLCAALRSVSPDLVKKDVFVVGDEGDLPLPFGACLSLYTRDDCRAKKPDVRRIYAKEHDAELGAATHLWMGDYTADQGGKGIEAYAQDGITLPRGDDGKPLGIQRLGVLRADVDNLGAAFSHGLSDDRISISRTAVLSHALSYFFKHQLNDILANPSAPVILSEATEGSAVEGSQNRGEGDPTIPPLRGSTQDDEKRGGYRAQIIYSGGDDIFLIGNWLDVIYAALDIKHALDAFTGNGALTISVGIGMYDAHYPLARMAAEVGELEDVAKAHPGKNALALWSVDNVFSWDTFEEDVLSKLCEIERVFQDNDKGKAFIYKLIELLRNTAAGDVISVPRLAYLLARSFEGKGNEGAAASKQFFEWALDQQQCRALTTALEIYVYSIRERD